MKGEAEMPERKELKEIIVVAPEDYAEFARQLAQKISEQPGGKGTFWTTKQYENKEFQLGRNQLAILLGDADENPITKSRLPGIKNLCNHAGACFGFDATTAVAFGEGKLEQREEFQKVLEKCATILAGASGVSSLGVSLAAAIVIYLPKTILMPGLVKLATQVRRKEMEKRLRTEQTKAALTLFLAEHVHAWAGVKKKGQPG
ncbi:MAG TPA: hypothetical protein VLM91_04305 [Candidatus Methylomirabilis sp.]|nr:hypothetical protein [Candidatus Methylomirabilis sp.]